MVAYSFCKRFVAPILRGLHPEDGVADMKMQTIRADRRRHARPGEELQLYCGMRTKSCFLIGRATCTEVRDIAMDPSNDWFAVDHVMSQPSDLDAFARRDGFVDWDDMRKFWREGHPGVDHFAGVLIMWRPIIEQG